MADGDNSGASGQGRNKEDKESKEKNEQESQREESRKKARPWVKLGLFVFIVALVIGGFYYWWTTRNEESTDDAFTSGRVITIAPHVSGYVTELDVNDNQFVHQGQILARIDPRDFEASRDQAKAAMVQAEGQLQGAKFSVEVAKKNFPGQLKEAQGQLLIAQAAEINAQSEYNRQHSVPRAATTQQAIDQSTASLKQAQGQVAQAEGQVEQNAPTLANISSSSSRITEQSGALAQAQAQMATADLNLEWTVIRAPHDGWIAQRNIERGNYVQSGQSLFSIVDPEIWIVGNFKETQLTRMRPGQPVKITVDAYPSMKLSGHLDSVQKGSGGQFSAFPPENATGNFVKIVQRVPVKIIIDDGLDPNQPLPIGISVEPTVNVADPHR